jgi:hypothetical protein
MMKYESSAKVLAKHRGTVCSIIPFLVRWRLNYLTAKRTPISKLKTHITLSSHLLFTIPVLFLSFCIALALSVSSSYVVGRTLPSLKIRAHRMT